METTNSIYPATYSKGLKSSRANSFCLRGHCLLRKCEVGGLVVYRCVLTTRALAPSRVPTCWPPCGRFYEPERKDEIPPSPQLEWLGTEETREDKLQCGYFKLLKQQSVDPNHHLRESWAEARTVGVHWTSLTRARDLEVSFLFRVTHTCWLSNGHLF